MIIEIDLNSETPIYMQIRNQIVLGIAKGNLDLGEKLPSVRQLALDLGINHMTVSKTYNQLKQEGLIVVNRSEGTKVRDMGIEILPKDFEERLMMLIAEGVAKTNDREKFLNDLISYIKNMSKGEK